MSENEPGGDGVQAPWTGAEGMWNVGEGENAAPWYSTIPEESVRATMETKQYKNPGELAMAYHNLQAVQQNPNGHVALLGQDATDEQRNEFFNKLGRPETPDGYELPIPDGQEDTSMKEWAAPIMHKHGLTAAQAKGLAEDWNKFVAETSAKTSETEAQENEAAMKALEASWGGELTENKAAGERVIKALGLSNELLDKVDGEIGSAALTELLAKIGRSSDEGTLKTGGSGGDDIASMTPQNAQAKINELRMDPEFNKNYLDKDAPGHAAAVQKMLALEARAAARS